MIEQPPQIISPSSWKFKSPAIGSSPVTASPLASSPKSRYPSPTYPQDAPAQPWRESTASVGRPPRIQANSLLKSSSVALHVKFTILLPSPPALALALALLRLYPLYLYLPSYILYISPKTRRSMHSLTSRIESRSVVVVESVVVAFWLEYLELIARVALRVQYPP